MCDVMCDIYIYIYIYMYSLFASFENIQDEQVMNAACVLTHVK